MPLHVLPLGPSESEIKACDSCDLHKGPALRNGRALQMVIIKTHVRNRQQWSIAPDLEFLVFYTRSHLLRSVEWKMSPTVSRPMVMGLSLAIGPKSN